MRMSLYGRDLEIDHERLNDWFCVLRLLAARRGRRARRDSSGRSNARLRRTTRASCSTPSARPPTRCSRCLEPDRVVIDLTSTSAKPGFDPSVVAVGRKRLKVAAAPRGDSYRVVHRHEREAHTEALHPEAVRPYGHRLVVDLYSTEPKAAAPVGRPAPDNRDVMIAIDAGHGGEDPGALGPDGIREKACGAQIAKTLVRLSKRCAASPACSCATATTTWRTASARQSRATSRRSLRVAACRFVQEPEGRAAHRFTRCPTRRVQRNGALACREGKPLRPHRRRRRGDLDDKDAVLAHVLLDLSMDAPRVRRVSCQAGRAQPLARRLPSCTSRVSSRRLSWC